MADINHNAIDKAFDVSQSAADRISYLLNIDNKKFFRIAVIGGGCSGFQYNMDCVDEKSDTDFLLEKNGVSLLIDDISLPFLEGSILDYEETLGSSEFKIKNPQATARCGCGNSFSI
jgi:iron-sulfur cluster insertion protein